MSVLHLLLLALIWGTGMGRWMAKPKAWLYAGLVPPVALLLWLLASEYLLPYRGGGASMWPLALVFWSLPLAGAGIIGVLLGTAWRKRR